MKSKISVIMSVFNDERFVKEAIESILKQSLKDFEFIIVNDGSIDNTLNIIRKYAKLDKRIKVINNKHNFGLVKSLNNVIKIAKGKYIARMDADDISVKERLQVQYDFLEEHTDIFIVGSYSININENGEKVSTFKPPTSYEMISKVLIRDNPFRHSSIMVRNTLDYYYREKMWYAQDYDLYLRCLSNNNKLANIPQYLVYYRISSKSISFSKRGRQILFGKKATEFYYQRLRNGKDNYQEFDEQKVLHYDTESSIDSDVIYSEIRASFACFNFNKTKSYILKYFKNYGIFARPHLIIYYLMALTNPKIIMIIKRVIKS